MILHLLITKFDLTPVLQLLEDNFGVFAQQGQGDTLPIKCKSDRAEGTAVSDFRFRPTESYFGISEF